MPPCFGHTTVACVAASDRGLRCDSTGRPVDSKPNPAQVDPHHDGEVLTLTAKDWTDAEEALAELAHVALDRRRPAASSDFSAGPRVIEPSLDVTLRAASLNDGRFPTDRPVPGRRTTRKFARFLLTALVGVGATLAWQSYGGEATQMIASSAPQLGWLLPSLPATDAPSGQEIAIEQPNPPVIGAPTPQPASMQAGTVAPTSSEGAASTAPGTPSPESQLETMALDLAAVRQSVEQLAAGQEQMARDLARLETTGQELRRRISALPPTAATARKPVPPPPQGAPQSSAAPLPPVPPPPAQSSAAPPPPASPEVPRPPMPVR